MRDQDRGLACCGVIIDRGGTGGSWGATRDATAAQPWSMMRALFGARRHLHPLQMSRRCRKPTISTKLADELRSLSGCSLAFTLAVVSM